MHKNLAVIFTVLSICGCTYFMFVIAANNGERSQLPWLVSFISFILQDIFLLPIINCIAQSFLVKYKKRNLHRKNSLLKRIIINRVNVNFEKIVVRIFFPLKISPKFPELRPNKFPQNFQRKKLTRQRNLEMFIQTLKLSISINNSQFFDLFRGSSILDKSEVQSKQPQDIELEGSNNWGRAQSRVINQENPSGILDVSPLSSKHREDDLLIR